MKIHNIIILAAITLILAAFMSCRAEYRSFENSYSDYDIYIVKSAWHTGIVMSSSHLDSTSFRLYADFKEYRYIDFGWGDEKFYQHPGFHIGYAANAVLWPSSSVLRIWGRNSKIEDIIDMSDFTIGISLDSAEFTCLLDYIDSSLKIKSGEPVKTYENSSASIVFYKSAMKYHMFRTCNTWVAEALEYSGVDISPCCVITAGKLYRKLKKKGKVLKEK